MKVRQWNYVGWSNTSDKTEWDGTINVKRLTKEREKNMLFLKIFIIKWGIFRISLVYLILVWFV